MKNQALFIRKIKCRLLQFLFGALRVKVNNKFENNNKNENKCIVSLLECQYFVMIFFILPYVVK